MSCGNRKGSRELMKSDNLRKSRSIKSELNVMKVAFASGKKLKMQEDIIVFGDYSIEYRVLNFITVFSTFSTFVNCKQCKGDIKFQTASSRGLGFKIVVLYDSCPFVGI